MQRFTRMGDFNSPLGSAQRQTVRALFTAIGPQPSVEALDIDIKGRCSLP
jgi:hypothetical protein